MPVRKKAAKKEVEDVQKEEISSTSTLDSTCKSLLDVTNASIQPVRITKSLIKEKLNEKLNEIKEMEKRALQELDHLEAQIFMMTPAEKLNKPASLDNLADFAAILSESICSIISAPTLEDKTPAVDRPMATLKVPGSERVPRRSISHSRLSSIEETASPAPRRRRSCSAEILTPRNRFATPQPASALQTPAHRYPPSRIMMTNKYTVRKPMGPVQVSIPMKRVMRAGEEAISTAGSPLFVQGRVPREPEINIPLTNGVIINIDPNNPNQKMDMPQFDPETVQKIRILCRKLESCIE